MYTISSGSMTFEYDIPGISGLRISGLSIAEPANLNLYDPRGTVQDPDFLPLRLYNWHSRAWDGIWLHRGIFTTNALTAYCGPGCRVLSQLDNEREDSWLAPF